VQYASVGEAHLPLLARACNDDDMLVRRQALSIVTSLLRADYAKWRPGMFVWFARATAHEDEATRHQAKGLIRDVLLHKFPNLVYNNFIDVMKVPCPALITSVPVFRKRYACTAI
jgi:hypothetical protein